MFFVCVWVGGLKVGNLVKKKTLYYKICVYFQGSKVKKIIVSKTDTCAMFWKKNDELFYDVIPVDAMIKGTHIHTTHSF